jgi:Putative peptidoglycan binding domain
VRPIRTGDRGAAVEDVQRRLVALGSDLGTSGVDGVFLGATCAAVVSFQTEHRLDEDGEVGPLTWAALVDATFTLGDRLLYLRSPYLHGQDVRVLQSALSVLGFATGDIDGIFGSFTERAVHDFQVNTAIAADGVVGPETVRALEGLRHAWAGKLAQPPSELRASPVRAAAALKGVRVLLVCEPEAEFVASRLANLAQAAEPEATVRVAEASGNRDADLVIMMTAGGATSDGAVDGSSRGDALAAALAGAVRASLADGAPAVVRVADSALDDHAVQALAASLLDGLCLGLTRG